MQELIRRFRLLQLYQNALSGSPLGTSIAGLYSGAGLGSLFGYPSRSLHEELRDAYDIRSVQEMLGTYDTCDMRATLMHAAAFSMYIPAEKVDCLVRAGYSVDLPGCYSFLKGPLWLLYYYSSATAASIDR